MALRVALKNTGSAGSAAVEKSAARDAIILSKTPDKSVSCIPCKEETQAVEKALRKPWPNVETQNASEKAVEQSKDLNEPIVKSLAEKETPVEDANEEDKEFSKGVDNPSAGGSEEGEIKEIDNVIQEADYNEYKDKEHDDELIGEQSHGNEAAERPGCHEEGVEGDEVEMRAVVKESIELKEFEVFVGQLHKHADEEDLQKVFSKIGEVVEIRMPKKIRSGKNKGFAFVRFATVEQAKKAVAELKNPNVRGKKCKVSRNHDYETLLVRNICKSWSKEALKRKLSEYGIRNIKEITLMEDPKQEGLNSGSAFLEFPNRLEATTAHSRLQMPYVFVGINLCAEVTFATSSVEADEEVMAQVKSVFVDGLPPSWDERRVLKKFKIYGEIEEVLLARSMPAAKRQDFGFINFRTREAALACIEGVNNHELNDNHKKVTLEASLRNPHRDQQSFMHRVSARYGGSPADVEPSVRRIGDTDARRMGARDTQFGVNEGRRLHERPQHFGRAYDSRARNTSSSYIRSDVKNYREHKAYLDRRAKPVETVKGRSSESITPPRAPYPQKSTRHRINRMPTHLDEHVPRSKREHVRRSKRPYSEVNDDLPSAGKLSRSRRSSYKGDYSRSSYKGDDGYHGAAYSETITPRRGATYPEKRTSHRINRMLAHLDEHVSRSKRRYSVVNDDLPSAGKHSRSRLD